MLHMKIITLTTQKGGTGKTTLATSLAVAAMEAGETVAAFDLDPQGSLARWGELRTAETPIVETFPAKNVAQLPEMVRGLANKGFSLVIIDTPGADNTATHKAMEAASWCLVPIRPTRLDAMAVQQTVRALMRGDKPFAFVLNQCPSSGRSSRAADMAAGLSALGFLAEPPICSRTDYQDAFAAGQGVTEFAPKGRAAEEVRALWTWINRQAPEVTQ